jgi:hypothetical protein
MFLEYEGNIPVVFSVKEDETVRNFYTDYKITINDDLINNVRGLIGDNAVLFSTI